MIWTTSNYEGTTYADGTPIPYISNFEEWQTATTGAYTYLYQDATAGYGKIYNLHAIRGRHDNDESTPNLKFAPDGWHVPSATEWNYLKTLYDSNSVNNSYALKSTTSWKYGLNGTNISGLDFKGYSLLNIQMRMKRITSSIQKVVCQVIFLMSRGLVCIQVFGRQHLLEIPEPLNL